LDVSIDNTVLVVSAGKFQSKCRKVFIHGGY
jgi:hypothetical protein